MAGFPCSFGGKAPSKAKPQEGFAAGWPKLSDAATAIYEQKPSPHTFQSLKRLAEQLCDTSGKEVYTSLRGVVEAHVQRNRAALAASMASADTDFLKMAAKQWKNFLTYIVRETIVPYHTQIGLHFFSFFGGGGAVYVYVYVYVYMYV